MSRRTSRSQYRVRYGQPLGNDGVSVVLFAILCVISATTPRYHAPCVPPPDPRTPRPLFALRRQTQRSGRASGKRGFGGLPRLRRRVLPSRVRREWGGAGRWPHAGLGRGHGHVDVGHRRFERLPLLHRQIDALFGRQRKGYAERSGKGGFGGPLQLRLLAASHAHTRSAYTERSSHKQPPSPWTATATNSRSKSRMGSREFFCL